METPGKHVSRSRLTAFVSRPQAFGKSGMRLIVCSQAAVTQPATRNMNIPSSLQSCSCQSNNKLGLCCLILCTSTCWRGYHHMTKGRQVVNIPAAWHKQVSYQLRPIPCGGSWAAVLPTDNISLVRPWFLPAGRCVASALNGVMLGAAR